MKICQFRFLSTCAVFFALSLFVGMVLAQAPENKPTHLDAVQGNTKLEADDAQVKARIVAKLKAIVIPVIELEDTTLDEAVDFLRARAEELDPTTEIQAEKGINFFVRQSSHAPQGQAVPHIRSLKLKNVTLANALQIICESVGYRYSVGPEYIILEAQAAPANSAPAPVPARPSTSHFTPRSRAFQSSELSKALSPLVKPDIASAKIVLANLQKLADGKSGAEKVAILQVATVVKNAFSADFMVASKMKMLEKAETEAVQQEQLAADWMKPNAFGSINEVAARAALVRADEIRKKAQAGVVDARENLILQLRDADTTILIYHKKNDLNVVSTLATAMLMINERSLPEDAHRPAFTRAQIASLDQLTQFRDEWLAEAQNAEKSLNYEKAISLYGKARDLESCKRCANLLAANLEEQNLWGSALEYYEMAGNHEKAGEIRRNNPNMLADQFKVLTPDELYAKIAPCCVRVTAGKGHGSGFFFKRGGYILTNKHVIGNGQNLTVKFDDASSFPAKLMATSEDYDLAIIKIDLEDHSVIGFRTQEVKIGLSVSLVGFPEVDLPTSTMNSGLISNTDRTFRGNPVYQLDVSVNHGNSGGPVVDQNGQLVGVVTFTLNDFDKDKFNFAIQVGTVAEFVQEHMK